MPIRGPVFDWHLCPDEERTSGVDRLVSETGFVVIGKGTREQFTKLLLLDFLASNVYLWSAGRLRACRPLWPEAEIMLDFVSMTTAKEVPDANRSHLLTAFFVWRIGGVDCLLRMFAQNIAQCNHSNQILAQSCLKARFCCALK